MAASSSSADAQVDNPQGIGIVRLMTSVITLIVGAGVFTMSADLPSAGGSGTAIITAWAITAFGVLCLTMTFYALSRIKPKLKGGIYSYASAGFGEFLGFNSAWGYWISALLCVVSFSSLLMGSLANFFPIFENGNNLASVIGASCLIWFYTFLVSRGIHGATGVNVVITICKFVPIFTAILAIVFLGCFDPDVFVYNLTHATQPDMPFWEQVRDTMMFTMWVFVGIEGAVAISGRAKKDSDVGKATIIAFCCVVCIYLMVSLLSMGVLPLDQLAELETPALAGVMQAAVGDWGSLLINCGVVISLVGAMLGYVVLCSESPFEAAKQGVFTKGFAKTNKQGAPTFSLVISGLVIEAFLIAMMFGDQTYRFFYVLSAGMILLPYLLSAAYFVKISIKEPEGFKGKVRAPLWLWRVVGVVGVIYSAVLAYASGAVGLTIMSLLYAPGILVYIKGKKERGQTYLTSTVDKVVVAVILVAAVVSVFLFATGQVSF